MIPTQTSKNNPAFEQFRLDMLKTLKAHTGDLAPDHMLAVAAYTVGQILAMQDQTKITSEEAVTLVQENMQLGNEHVISQVSGQPAGHA